MKQFSDYADILIMAPCYLGYLWMADKFCKKYLETSKKKELLFICFSLIGWLFLDIMNRRYFTLHIFFLISEHILFVGLVLLLFRERWEKKLLAASVLMTVMRLVLNIAEPVLICAVLFYKHAVKKIPEPFLNEWEAGIICCADFCLVILAVHLLSGRLASVFHGKSGRWYVILAAPLFAVITVLDVANWGACYGIMIRSGGNMGLYYDQIFSHTEFCALAVIFMSAAGFYLFAMNRIYLEQRKNSQYRAQVAVYKMLEEQYSRSERLRHDLKNHVVALSGLWEDRDWEKLGAYLKKMENSAGLGQYEEATGNRVVDVLLYQKRKTAEAKKIVWECDVRIPKPCGINEFDLCVLFGNILDNAVEACEKSGEREAEQKERPYIHVRAGTVKKCFLLEVANSTDVTDRSKCGSAGTEHIQERGIGLLNVGDVVERYDGAMRTEIQDGVFVISVLIPLEEAVHDMKRVV